MHISDIDPDTADIADVVACLQDLYARVEALESQLNAVTSPR